MPLRLRVLVVVAAAVTAVLATAAPASAHATGGPAPTNYRTVVAGVTPPLAGVTVRVTGPDGKLSVVNRGADDVVVLGYDGEPYLRVGPSGVFENRRSPATYRNRTRLGVVTIPPSADPSAAPEWRRVGDCCTATWHDHRAHWMGSQPPPEVRADPSTPRVVSADWSLQLQQGSTVATVKGDVLWVPGPQLWPWLVGALVVAAIVVAASRLRPWPVVIGVALALLLTAEAVHVVGGLLGTTGSGSEWIGLVLALAAWCFGVFTLGFLIRRDGVDAAPSVLVAGLAIGVTGGFSDLDVFTYSQLPTSLAPGLARVLVMATIGLSLGLVIAAGLRLRRPTPTPNASCVSEARIRASDTHDQARARLTAS